MSTSGKRVWWKILAGLAATLLLMSGAVALTAPAQAVEASCPAGYVCDRSVSSDNCAEGAACDQSSARTCPKGYVCAYADEGFGGRKIMMKIGCWNFGKCGFSASFNDLTTSVVNASGSTFCFWTDESYRGRKLVVPPGRVIPNVGDAWNDSFTSAHVRGSGGAGC